MITMTKDDDTNDDDDVGGEVQLQLEIQLRFNLKRLWTFVQRPKTLPYLKSTDDQKSLNFKLLEQDCYFFNISRWHWSKININNKHVNCKAITITLNRKRSRFIKYLRNRPHFLSLKTCFDRVFNYLQWQ